MHKMSLQCTASKDIRVNKSFHTAKIIFTSFHCWRALNLRCLAHPSENASAAECTLLEVVPQTFSVQRHWRRFGLNITGQKSWFFISKIMWYLKPVEPVCVIVNFSGRNLPCPSSLSALKDALLQEVMSIGLWRVPLTHVSPIQSKIFEAYLRSLYCKKRLEIFFP
jgi:hypothetical protein